jgi:multimeric flavodoxin WrbA
MNICILNGNPHQANDHLEIYMDALVQELEAKGDRTAKLDLREMKIRYCSGCFGCWIKTPGECVSRDDSALVCQEVIRSDLALFVSPVLEGFPSALLKKAQDKLIPLVHPYIGFVKGEAHHLARYDHYPRMGLLLHRSEDTEDEDIRIISRIYARAALNLKSSLAFTKTTENSITEVVNEIGRL